jgi:hypothetical protein
MLSKCANPDCSERFLYFRRGKLFRWDADTRNLMATRYGEDPGSRKPPRRVEFFWLCDDCAANMTLSFQDGAGVTAKPLVKAQTAAS